MSAASAVLLALGVGALLAFGIWRDRYHSPLGAAAVTFLGVGAVAAAGVALWVHRQAVDPAPTRRVHFLAEREVLENEAARSRLADDLGAARRAGIQPEVFVFGPSGPADVTSDGALGRDTRRFPDLASARAGVRWDTAVEGQPSVLYARLPGLRSERGWHHVNPFPPEQDVLSVEMFAPGEGFTGMPLEIRARVRPNGVPLVATLLRSGRPREQMTVPAEVAEDAEPLSFRFLPEEMGEESVTLAVHNQQGRLVARRSARLEILPRPLVHYYGRPGRETSLAALLTRTGFAVERRAGSELASVGEDDAAAPELVVLDELSPSALRPDVVRHLARRVAEAGSTLLVIPGEMRSGSYKGSPLEPLLPVWIGPKDDDKLRLAVVAVVDTSLSMAFLHGGVRKMDMAKEALLRLTAAMKREDRLGILGVEDRPYWVVPPGERLPHAAVDDRIRRMLAIGGGISLYSGVLEARERIRELDADVKHLMVLVDTADVDEYEVSGRGTVEELAGNLRRAGVSLSFIGFGAPTDVHIPTLSGLADAAGGYFYLTSDLREVPGFFLRDLDEISKNVILRRPMGTAFDPREFPLIDGTPQVRGQLVTTLKPDGTPYVWSDRGYPLLATRRLGKGTVSVFAADSGTDLGRPWFDSAKAESVWSALLAKIAARPAATLRLFADVEGHRVNAAAAEPPGGDRGEAPLAASWQPPDGPPRSFRVVETAPGEFELTADAERPGPHALSVSDVEETRRLEVQLDVAEAEGEALQGAETREFFGGEAAHRRTLDTEEALLAIRMLILAALAFLCLQDVFRAP